MDYRGRCYIIGSGHKEFTDKKIIDEDYYVLTLAAIAREMNTRKLTGGKIVVAAGLPLTWMVKQQSEYKKESIMNFFGSTYGGAEMLYSVEEEPLYTGGAICQALALCRDERVTVVNGDTFFGVDLAAMRRFAEDRGRQIVIAVREMRDFSRYGRVETNVAREVIAFHEKQPCAQGFINGGIYDLSRTSLEGYPQRFSMEEECFPKLLQSKQILAFPSDGLFIDIGIPKDYERAQTLFGEAK